jgi:hypothetical protein
MRIINLARAREIAYAWHSGGGSAFYQFASTAKIHSEEHRAKCLSEVAGDIAWTALLPEDLKALRQLERFFRYTKIGGE